MWALGWIPIHGNAPVSQAGCKPGQARTARGEPPLQRTCVGTGILQTELRHHPGQDRWLHTGSNDSFVPAQEPGHTCFPCLLFLGNPFH